MGLGRQMSWVRIQAGPVFFLRGNIQKYFRLIICLLMFCRRSHHIIEIFTVWRFPCNCFLGFHLLLRFTPVILLALTSYVSF